MHRGHGHKNLCERTVTLTVNNKQIVKISNKKERRKPSKIIKCEAKFTI